jgi:hypothetical protein
MSANVGGCLVSFGATYAGGCRADVAPKDQGFEEFWVTRGEVEAGRGSFV